MEKIIKGMRGNKYSWILGCVGFLALAYVVYVITGDAVFGLTLAFPAVVGVPAPGTITTQEQQRLATDTGWDVMSDVEQKVTLLRPDIAPLDTMLRSIGSKPTDSYEVKWGEAGFGEGYVEVDTAGASQLSAGAVVSIPLTPDTFKLAVTSAVYMYVDSGGNKVGLYVNEKTTTGTNNIICTVIDGNGTNILPSAIPAAEKLFFNGVAKNELDAQTEPFQRMPEINSNYCQIQMCQIEQGLYDQKQKKELDWGLLEFKSDALYNFRYGCENTALMGVKDRIQNLNGGYIYTAGGLENYVGWHLYYNPKSAGGTGLDMSMFFELGEAVFTSIAGSDSRVLFMSPQLMTEFLKCVEFQKMMSESKTELVYGLRCNQIDTGFGLFNIRLHKGLGRTRAGQGCVVDLSRIKMRVFDPMHWRDIELLKSGQSKADAWTLEERTTFEFRAKASHAWIYPTTGAAGVQPTQ